ncbi:hypothetical protein V7S43_011551 [Phytophthora oleae]|uniref:Trs120/TRAPPC9 N-terminal domain-containing protein n=1 Tax=Phytophthora oleae TaxID=2107226 RepID=A0ABD3FDQ1_9STRA
MDTLAVNLLMSLESAIRSATFSAATIGLALKAASGDLASVLLDVNVEPQQVNSGQQQQASPLVLSRDTKGDALFGSSSSPTSRSSLTSIPSPLAAGVAALDPRNRRRKRQLARREKLLGDFSVLVSCISDAVDHYTVAVEMLREEERRSGGAPGDALWLAAALEGYVFCLYTETPSKFSTELVEKASEAVAFYAKAGTTELESLFIENLGWYYASVAIAPLTRASLTGEARLLESVWGKRLLWELLERGLLLFPELQPQRQAEFLIQTSRMLKAVGHRRRVALFLHEAASLLLARNAPSVDAQSKLLLSPSSVARGPQRQRDLEAALVLERVAAEHLGIEGGRRELPWEVTTQYRRNRRRKTSGTSATSTTMDNSWLIIRFHVLRQLLTIARMLGDALLVGKYCLQLLEMLVWCDSIAASTSADSRASKSPALLVDHLQEPATSIRVAQPPIERAAAGLHVKSGAYFSPPPGIDTRVRRNFINSPSATMSNAAASLSSTLTNTPRILATPRQQFSAAVNAISTKATPAFTPFSHHQHNGTLTSRTDERTPTARAANMADGRDFGDDGGLKGGSEGDFDGKIQSGAVLEAVAVWNLRSKTEIAKIERKLLNLLETDCTTLRASDQVELPTFLRVDKLKLHSSCNLQHPFLSRSTALELFGAQSASSQQAAKSDFFYSPFEKQKLMQKAEEEDVDDAPAMYERGFPLHEQIELQLTLSNPTGVAVKLQEVRAWVTFAEEDDEGAKDGAVECYPCFFTLEPYQKRKTVVLGIQPLRVGTCQVRGCFIKTFNVKTSFELRSPVNIRVVGELPLVSLSLREHGSLTLLGGEKTKEPATGKMRLAMFSSETRRCMLRVRSTGNRSISNYRLAVNVQHRRAAKKTYVVFNNLPTATEGSTNGRCKSDDQIETQILTLRCGKVVSPSLPLASGDFVSIPFELSLKGGPADDEIQIEWSFVYGDEAADAVYYRETKLLLQLVPLPSLTLQSVALLPCSSELLPTAAKAATTDHLYCAIMVHIANPTETTFRFRLHRDMDDSGEAACEAEIGRQCSRRFVVEVPRLLPDQEPLNVVQVLNEMLEMEWETYFGTRGRLLCEEQHFGPIDDQRRMKRELLLPPVSLELQSPLTDLTPVVDFSGLNGYASKPKHGRDRSLSLPPLTFFQATHLRVEARVLDVKLFQYVPISIKSQRTDGGEQSVSGVEAEVVVTEEGGEDMSEHVVVVGLLKTQLLWDGPMDRDAKAHEIQCMFLSEGVFRVAVCGRVLDQEAEGAGGEVWSHQPLHVRVRSTERSLSTI